MQSEVSKAGPTLPGHYQFRYLSKRRSCMRSKDWTLGQRNDAPTEKQVLSIAKAQVILAMCLRG